MNFFSTKDTVKTLINQKWEKEGFGGKIQWLSNIFKNDNEFLKELLDLQWNSIKSGFKTESDVISDILNYFKNKEIEVDVEYYPPGHKTDRYEKIDFKLTPKDKNFYLLPKDKKSFTMQVKPLRKMEEIDGDKIKIQTYRMEESYKSKPNLDYIVYGKTPNFLVFKNSNYKVSKDGNTVTHNDKPIINTF